MIGVMNLRKLFEKEGLSLAGTLAVVCILAIGVGVVLGNWVIRIIAGPGPQELEVAEREITQEEQILQDLHEPVPPPAEEDEPAEGYEEAYVVQAGVFNSRENAETLKNMLQGEGFEVWVTDAQPYRVHLGVYSDREKAEQIRDEAERKGFDIFIAH